MKKSRNILVLIIFLAILIFLIITIKDKVPDNIFSYLDIGTYHIPPGAVEVNSSNYYGQSFISNFDNLFMMSIFVPKQEINKNDDLYFHLKNSKEDSDDLVMLKWKFKELKPSKNSFYVIPPDREWGEEGFHFHFQFPPIKNSKNREFYFYFASPNTKTEKGIKLGVWKKKKYYEALTKGKLYRNNESTEGFLAFRTYNTWKGNLFHLKDKIITRLKMDKVFMLIFFLGIAGIIISIVVTDIRIRKIKKGRENADKCGHSSL